MWYAIKQESNSLIFLSLKLISETRALYCEKDKTASNDHGVIAGK